MKARAPDPAQRSSPRLWFFRAFAAVGIPLLLLLALEGGLRLAGYGHPAAFLIPDDRPGYVRSNPDFAGFFLPASYELRPLNFRLAAHKAPNTVRVVLLGESAAQGVPAPAFALAPQLRAQLRARYPDKTIEVINTGIVAINSHAVYRVARDLAAYAPDLFLVYMGNNEVVGPYGPGCAYLSESPPLWLIRLSVQVRSTRTGQLLTSLLGRLQPGGRAAGAWDGMATFVNNAVRGDDPRLETVYRNFGANLRDIVRVGTNAGAKVLLCTVVSNLKDCAPFLSLHRPGLAAAEQTEWQQAFDRGKLAWLLGEAGPARTSLNEALRLDPQYADTEFLLGKLALEQGDPAGARTHLLAAQHWDALRFRPDPRINTIIREVARTSPAGVSLLDAATELGSDPAAPGEPAGRELLLEHVHLNWEGNHRLARLMAMGAAAVLSGDQPSRSPGLDSAACANALAFTEHGRLTLLQKTAAIVRKPPFTNQLTYPEDQAVLAREITRLGAAVQEPGALRRCLDVAQAAIAADPENPTLRSIAEELALELGDTAGALEQARQAAQRLPADPANFADEASLLAQLGRNDEAEAVLRQGATAAQGSEALTPSFAALYARMKRYDLSRAALGTAIARHPAETKYHLMLGNIERMAGDAAAAEREFRAALAIAPADQSALEALVALLAEQGKTEQVEQASLAAAEPQAKNQVNNLRVAASYEARGDEAQAVRYLQAAEQSGPGTAGVELRIARILYRLGRKDELMLHLARAKRLARIEEDPESTASITELIARIAAQRP